MRQEIILWGMIIAFLLLGITWVVLYSLRNIIKYYKVPEEILPAKHKLIAVNALVPLIPAILIINNFISKIPTLKIYFDQNELLYPISMFATILFLIIVIGLTIEQYLILTNTSYKNYMEEQEKGS